MSDCSHLANDPRVTIRRSGEPDPEGGCVVYWMQRSQRANDNPALDVAIAVGNELGKPVVVFLAPVPFYPNANHRHYQFLFDGFPDLEPTLARRRVGLVFRMPPDHRVDAFAAEVRASLVVGDENPLRDPESWRVKVARRLRVPFWTVDSDVVVPSALLEKEQYSARVIRPRLRRHLDRFLSAPRNTKARVEWKTPTGVSSRSLLGEVPSDFPVDRTAAPVDSLRGGPMRAQAALRRFVRDRLAGYSTHRNRPEQDGTSQLSPFLHFGHIGPRTVARAVSKADAPAEDRNVFLEELIVRRELAINFVRFNPFYDQLDGCEPWAVRTLREHVHDTRLYVYSEAELEGATTHDPLWNAAQRQMVESGWMHGYMRMYWAKKILEWSVSAEVAMDTAIRLNDRYQLDGRDPNGYAGIAWAIGGKHDRAWGPERTVFGKVRYMSYQSTRRKFKSDEYVARWYSEDGEA